MTSTELTATVEPVILLPENIESTNIDANRLSVIFADKKNKKKNQKATAYQPQNKDNHHKTPNRPPHGTRRSMGKR